MFNPFRNLGEKFTLIKARYIERKSDFEGALKFLESRSFHSRYGRVFSKLYRAKLLLVTSNPGAKSEAAQLTHSLGNFEGLQDEAYFRAYAAYLSAIMANDELLMRRAIDDLAGQNANVFVLGCLPHFPMETYPAK